MDTELISRENAAWLAGIIEGEGSFMLIMQKYKDKRTLITVRPAISITNMDIKLLIPASKLLYNLKCKFYSRLKKTKNGFALSIEVVGTTVKNLIFVIRPFLRSKTDQADLLIEFLFWKKAYINKLGYNKYIPFYKLSVEEQKSYIDQQTEFRNRLFAMRHKSINPQRLKRTASFPLEMMV